MDEKWLRSARLIGRTGLQRLQDCNVAVIGLGGVGSYAVEALCRSGIGRLILVDHDRVAATNFNRQLLATSQTMGQLKTAAARERIVSINPDCQVIERPFFWPAEISEEQAADILPRPLDYIIDAIDTVSAKISLIQLAKQWQVPIISCMGTGNKLDPSRLRLLDLYQTSVCPLARVMRRELRKRQIGELMVVCSDENPQNCLVAEPGSDSEDRAPASMAFVPGSAGLLLASAVVRDLLVKPLQ